MAKKSHKLDGNHELPFALIALSCSESQLKTAWGINKTLAINLKESESIVPLKDNSELVFAVFSDVESSVEYFFSLISNKTNGILLIKELSNIDYIFEISGRFAHLQLNDILKKLKQTPGIQAALLVNPEKIKRKNAFCSY